MSSRWGSPSPLERMVGYREEAERAMREEPGLLTALSNLIEYKILHRAATLWVDVQSRSGESFYSEPEFDREYARDVYRETKAMFSKALGKFSGVKEEIKEEVDHIKSAIEEPPQYGQGVA